MRVIRWRWKTPWEMSTTRLGSEPGDGAELDDNAADWSGTRRAGGSLYHKWGEARWKEQFVILRLEWTDGWRRVTNVDDRVNREGWTVMRLCKKRGEEDWKSLYVVEITVFNAFQYLEPTQSSENIVTIWGSGNCNNSTSKNICRLSVVCLSSVCL